MAAVRWAVDADGDWETAADWKPHAPTTADDVTINTAVLHTITHSAGTDAVDTLTVGDDDFVVSGGALSVGSTSSFANGLTVSGGTLALGGAATVASFTQDGGEISGGGTVTVSGQADFSGTFDMEGAGVTLLEGSSQIVRAQVGLEGYHTLENEGTLTILAPGPTQAPVFIFLGYDPITATYLRGGTLRNDASGVIDVEGRLEILQRSGLGIFYNAGTFEADSTTGGIYIEPAVTQSVDEGGVLENTGKIIVKTGTLDVDETFIGTGSGTVTVSSGATLDLDAGGAVNSHALRCAAGSTLVLGGYFTVGAGERFAGSVSIGGTIAFGANAATLIDITEYGVISGSGVVTVTGTTQLKGGGQSGSGVTLLQGSTTMKPSNGNSDTVFDLDGGRVLENQGAFTMTNAYLQVGLATYGPPIGGGTFQNDAAGVIDINGASSIDGEFGVTLFANAGTLEQTVTRGVTHFHYMTATNTGVISVETGTIDFDGAFTQNGAGSASVSSGARLEFTGGAAFNSGDLSVASEATLVFEGESAFTGALSNAGTLDVIGKSSLVIENSTIRGAGGTIYAGAGASITLQHSSLQGGSAGDALSIAASGVITLSEGSQAQVEGALANGGSLVIDAADLVILPGGATLSSGGTVSLGGGASEILGGAKATSLTNTGDTISGAGVFGGRLDLTTAASGVIDATGAMRLGASIVISNAGLMESTASGLMLISGTTIENTGGQVAVDAAFRLSAATITGGSVDIAAGGALSSVGASAISGSVMTNAGKLLSDGGLLTVQGDVANTGLIETVNGGLAITGTVSGSGTAKLAGSGSLQIDGVFAENVAFTTGATGTLILGDSAAFTASISGLSTSGANRLDLKDVGFVDADEATYVDNGHQTGGVLTVTDGTHTAHITLVGDYAPSSFVAASDGAGGTTVTDPAAAGFAASMAAVPAARAARTYAPPAPPLVPGALLTSPSLHSG